MIVPTPRSKKITPPFLGSLHATKSATSRRSAGILCMKSPTRISHHGSPIAKISRLISRKNVMRRIVRMRGSQWSNPPLNFEMHH